MVLSVFTAFTPLTLYTSHKFQVLPKYAGELNWVLKARRRALSLLVLSAM